MHTLHSKMREDCTWKITELLSFKLDMCSKSWYHFQNQQEAHTLWVCQFLVSWIAVILEENNYVFIQITVFIKVVLLDFSIAECVCGNV